MVNPTRLVTVEVRSGQILGKFVTQNQQNFLTLGIRYETAREKEKSKKLSR